MLLRIEFRLVFGQFLISSWSEKGHEPSRAENPSARLGLINSRYVGGTGIVNGIQIFYIITVKEYVNRE